jgi:hypothetical protein
MRPPTPFDPLVTEHTVSVEWSNGYRATCSCGKYRSRRYTPPMVRALRAWEAHVRAVTTPYGCLPRPEEVAG